MALRKSSDVLAAWGLVLQNVRGDDGRAESLHNLSLMTNPTHLETLQNYTMLQDRRDDLNKAEAERLYASAVEANCAEGPLDDLKAPSVAAFETSRTGVVALVKRVDCGKQGVGRSWVEGEFQKRQGESCEEMVRREMGVVGKGREKGRDTQEEKRLRMEEKSQEKEKRVQTLAENTAGNNKDARHWGVKGGVTLYFGGGAETRRWGVREIKQETAEQTGVQDAYTSACAHHALPHAQEIKQEETAGQKGMHQLQHERESACARERARERESERESDLDRIFQAAEKKMKNWGMSRSGGGGVSGPSTPRSSPPSSLSPKTKKLATPAESTRASPEALQKSAYATASAPPRFSPPSSVSPKTSSFASPAVPHPSAYATASAPPRSSSVSPKTSSFASPAVSLVESPDAPTLLHTPPRMLPHTPPHQLLHTRTSLLSAPAVSVPESLDALQNSAYAAAYAASYAASYASTSASYACASASYASACASGMALLSVESQRDARGKACPADSFSACVAYVLK